MDQLSLIALDTEDLDVISAHLQDAVVRVGDMTYLPGERRFAMVVNRFNWAAAQQGGRRRNYERRRTGVHFNCVDQVRTQNLDRAAVDRVLSVLAVRFNSEEGPGGEVELIFAGGTTVGLRVECIEVSMSDLGAAWKTDNLPEHALDGDAPAES